ncbi:DUF302 domain-containing protein [Thiofaba sp. EF100]|jgi:uncharacterized protein (DUF302 family)|uniref:DUF302 domain-containing protein n=1 Tax=Thiofaba sp. EF100 TaxID=3121274 RepID=UPI003221884E
MVRNILALIGVIAIAAGGFFMVKMPGMMQLMPGMLSPEMAPIVERINKDAAGMVAAAKNLAPGAAEETATMLGRWVESKGEIAYTTTWERKVKDGVTLNDIQDALASVATERNIKAVGELPLSEELKARGIESGVLKVFSYCNPETARKMTNFAPHMAAYLPCRIVVVEKADGLWLYTLNMDMMLKMGQSLEGNPELKEAAMAVRDTIWEMMERASKGEI